MHNSAKWFLISIAVIILDQLTKYWVMAELRFGDVIYVTPFFNLVLTFNTGAAFSFLAEAGGWQRGFFIGVAVAVSIFISVMLIRHPERRLLALGLALIMGGALGNVIDRALLGHVIDFLDVHAAGYHWPAFNVADSAITVGAILLVWDSFREPHSRSGKAHQHSA